MKTPGEHSPEGEAAVAPGGSGARRDEDIRKSLEAALESRSALLSILEDQQETEVELRGKTALFEAAVNSALDGILVVDSNSKMIIQNQRMIDMWHFPADLSDESHDKRRLEWAISQVKNPRQFADRVAYLYAHPDEVGRDEVEMIDGRFFDRYSAPVLGRDGKHYGRIWAFRDITEQKKADDERDKLVRIIEESQDFIAMADLNGKITFMNAGGRAMIGMRDDQDPSEFNFADYVPEKWQTFFRDTVIRTTREKGKWEGEMQIRHLQTGALVNVSRTVFVIRDAGGAPTFFATVTRDITERNRAVAQIAEQADLLDQARDAIVKADLESRIEFWNMGAERMYGWTSQEAVGKKITELIAVHPEALTGIMVTLLEKGVSSGEMEHVTKDGRRLTVEARRTLIRDEDGNPKSLLAIYTDITERKKIESQFLRAQRMESIGTLAGGIAHDLNNILAPILMSIDVLKTMATGPEAEEILNCIESSAKRGADIVRQVLSFARGIEGERVKVQPTHLLKELESIIKDTFPKDIQLRFSVPKDVWTILGDPTQVHQILLNLCVNARDAMPSGGILTIDVENCTLDEQYATMHVGAKPGRYVVIRATDTGAGIRPAIIDKIFEPFFTTKDMSKGTGLGLSTVMAVAKSHGGFINVYSEPGKGAAFRVYLPAMETLPDPRRVEVEQGTPQRGNGQTILVVDDEASILTITAQTLRSFGYEVLTATDGADAVALYAQRRKEIAVVLTDMMMPIMDGTAMIHAMRRMNPLVKIVAASGLKEQGSMAKLTAFGIKHQLTKPYTSGVLLHTIATILHED